MIRLGMAFMTVLVLGSGSVFGQAAEEPESVTFAASDGVKVSGKLYGSSETALVLCHGRAYLKGADSFAEECRYLAGRGILCLALNFRGYPASAPPDRPGMEKDVIAALDYLVKRGARRVFVLGSSMGGFAALKAVPELSDKPQFGGIIVISAFDRSTLRDADCRKLVIVAEDDKTLHPMAMRMFRQAAAPKQALVYKTGGHGQVLFKKHGGNLLETIRVFVLQAEKGDPKSG